MANYEIRIGGAVGPLVTAHLAGLRSADRMTVVLVCGAGGRGALVRILRALAAQGPSEFDVRIVPAVRPRARAGTSPATPRRHEFTSTAKDLA